MEDSGLPALLAVVAGAVITIGVVVAMSAITWVFVWAK